MTTPEERRRVLEGLFGEEDWRRWWRFASLMALSIVVAVMGISLDSAAVVIGAMLIAPLMGPVMAFSVALTMGWPRRMATTGVWIVGASIGSIALAWLLAEVQPGLEVTNELLTRTSPDGRDLAVALAAGAAGGYAATREDISGALPGVAVAVALVPPLASTGVALAIGRTDLAEGAALLYVANLVAIILTSSVVFLMTGFVPWRRLVHVTPRVAVGMLIVLGVTVAIAVPLARQSFAFANEQETLAAVEERVDDWLGADSRLEVDRVRVDDNLVTIDVIGPESPPSVEELAAGLVDELGETVEVQVRWSQRSEPTGDTDAAADVDDEELRRLVEVWLAEGAGEQEAARIEQITVDGATVSVEVVGATPPPSAATLGALVEEELGTSVDVSIRWTEQREFRSDAPPDALVSLVDAVERWAADQAGVSVLDITLDGGVVTIDLAGESQPNDVSELAVIVERELGEPTETQVRFTLRELLFQGSAP